MVGTSPGTLSTLSVSISDPRMRFRLSLSVVLTSLPLLANQCCLAESPRLSPKRLKILILTTEPIPAPCCAKVLHIKGTIDLSMSVNPDGDVTCVEMISPTSTDLRICNCFGPAMEVSALSEQRSKEKLFAERLRCILRPRSTQ